MKEKTLSLALVGLLMLGLFSPVISYAATINGSEHGTEMEISATGYIGTSGESERPPAEELSPPKKTPVNSAKPNQPNFPKKGEGRSLLLIALGSLLSLLALTKLYRHRREMAQNQ